MDSSSKVRMIAMTEVFENEELVPSPDPSQCFRQCFWGILRKQPHMHGKIVNFDVLRVPIGLSGDGEYCCSGPLIGTESYEPNPNVRSTLDRKEEEDRQKRYVDTRFEVFVESVAQLETPVGEGWRNPDLYFNDWTRFRLPALRPTMRSLLYLPPLQLQIEHLKLNTIGQDPFKRATTSWDEFDCSRLDYQPNGAADRNEENQNRVGAVGIEDIFDVVIQMKLCSIVRTSTEDRNWAANRKQTPQPQLSEENRWNKAQWRG